MVGCLGLIVFLPRVLFYYVIPFSPVFWFVGLWCASLRLLNIRSLVVRLHHPNGLCISHEGILV
jgi:hypothetical protein